MVTKRYGPPHRLGTAVLVDAMTDPPVCDAAPWDALAASAAAVRAADDEPASARHTWRRLIMSTAYTAVLTGVVIAALHAVGTASPVRADGSVDAALFSYTNQDRASNGVRALSWNGTLGTIGEGGRYDGCPGLTVYGRSVDMINRNYFAHQILGCGQLVFSIMQAYGVNYRSAGENIGWNGGGAAAINSAFMNSPEHRANILNGNFTSLGVGTDSGTLMGYSGVWMFSEEFAQLGSSPPPPPPPPPPKPPARPSPPRNTPAPAAPHLPPAVVTAAPAPAPVAPPTPAPVPVVPVVPTPTPQPLLSLTVPPLPDTNGGLLFDSIESVLENYLIS